MCEALNILSRLFSHTSPRAGEKVKLSELNIYHLALQHYRGGRPVPRAASSYDGGKQIHANILAYVGFFSLLLAYPYPIQTTKSVKGLSDLHLAVVVEYFVQHKGFRPCDFRPGVGHPILADASCYCKGLRLAGVLLYA